VCKRFPRATLCTDLGVSLFIYEFMEHFVIEVIAGNEKRYVSADELATHLSQNLIQVITIRGGAGIFISTFFFIFSRNFC
jgi:hypothetical protein